MSATLTHRYSASSESAWRDCPRKWWWAHLHGYQLAERPEALAAGIRWHELLADYWQHGEQAAPDAGEPASYREARLQAMMAGYQQVYPLAARPKVVAVEQRFAVPLCDWRDSALVPVPGWSLVGAIDCLVEIAGEVWVVESKSSSEDLSPGSDYWKRLYLDPQISTYWIAAQSLGYDVAGVLYDVARKPDLRPFSATPAAARKYTKAGALYANQHEHDESPEAFYDRCLTAIREEPTRYFRREAIRRLVSQVQQHCRSMAAFARQMDVAAADNYAPQNPSSCNRFGQCLFFPVCCAGLAATPADIPGVYTTREERGQDHAAGALPAAPPIETVTEEDWF